MSSRVTDSHIAKVLSPASVHIQAAHAALTEAVTQMGAWREYEYDGNTDMSFVDAIDAAIDAAGKAMDELENADEQVDELIDTVADLEEQGEGGNE